MSESVWKMAITGETILSRCEKIRKTLDSCLSQIQNMVPLLLAAKVSGIIHDLRNANFLFDSADKEAGNAILALMQQDVAAATGKELEAFKLAALQLKITSPLAVLIEKRSIKRLIDKVGDSSKTRKKILHYLLNLLRKHGNVILQCQSNSTTSAEELLDYDDQCVSSPEPPQEFKCPISGRLMYDPVIIASGKTFERIWIERWFDECNHTCPITNTKLDHMLVTPNCAMKALITKWCSIYEILIPNPCLQPFPASISRLKISGYSSIVSFGSSMGHLKLQISNVSIHSSSNSCGSDLSGSAGNYDFKNGVIQMNSESQNSHSSDCSHGNVLGLIFKFAEISWESQCKVVEDVKEKLYSSDQGYLWTTSDDYVNPLIKFMNKARELCNLKAQREGAEVLLAILTKNRNEMPPFQLGDSIYVLTSYLDSEITGEVLAIIEILSHEQSYHSMMLVSGVLPSMLKVLQTHTREFHILAMKILSNLSTDRDIGYHMVYLDYIPKLVLFLDDRLLSVYVIEIIKKLCSIEEARVGVADNIAAIGKLLEQGVKEQEHVLNILQSLCHDGPQYCQLVMSEEIVECLVHLSVNGNSKVKSIALELLKYFGQTTCCSASVLSTPHTLNTSSSPCVSKRQRPSSRVFWLLGRDMSIFSKGR
uniref:RING-type E3 ubiquitin transferase n=1 Tax=Cannabis sativa TaxID=3483 RepID=A0A803NN33_CANSA